MAPRGAKPKALAYTRTRSPRVHDWVDVENVEFTDGPKLPPRRRDGSPWPGWIKSQWDAWRTMPHARLWHASDWSFAFDTIELASRAFDDGAKVSLLTELRYREKTMGTTWAARQDMRIRYVEPGDVQRASVVELVNYRDL